MIIRKLENFHKARIKAQMKAQMKAKIFAGICALSLTAACGTGDAPLQKVEAFEKTANTRASLEQKLTAGLAVGTDRRAAGKAFADDIIWRASAGQVVEALTPDADGFIEDESIVLEPELTSVYHATTVGVHNTAVLALPGNTTDQAAIDAADGTAVVTTSGSLAGTGGWNAATNPGVPITDISPSLTMLDAGHYFGDREVSGYTEPTVDLALKKRWVDGATNTDADEVKMVTHATITGQDGTSLNFYLPFYDVSETVNPNGYGRTRSSLRDVTEVTTVQVGGTDTPIPTGGQLNDTKLAVFRTSGYGIYGVYSWDPAAAGSNYQKQLVAFSLTSNGTIYTRDFYTAVTAAATAGVVQYTGKFLAFGKQNQTIGTDTVNVYDSGSSRGWIDMKVNFDTATFTTDLTFENNESGRQAFDKLSSTRYNDPDANHRVYANDLVVSDTISPFMESATNQRSLLRYRSAISTETEDNPNYLTNVNTIAFKGQVSDKDDSTYFVNFGGSLDPDKHCIRVENVCNPGADTGSIAGTFNGPAAEDVTGVFRYQGDLGDGQSRHYEGAFGAVR